MCNINSRDLLSPSSSLLYHCAIKYEMSSAIVLIHKTCVSVKFPNFVTTNPNIIHFHFPLRNKIYYSGWRCKLQNECVRANENERLFSFESLSSFPDKLSNLHGKLKASRASIRQTSLLITFVDFQLC